MTKYAVILFAFAAVGFAAEKPKVPECFKVNSMIRADEEHYWAAWTNACSYTIDSVYVIVRFADEANKLVGNGVWGLHFITPGASRVTGRAATTCEDPWAFGIPDRSMTAGWPERAGCRPERLPAGCRPVSAAAGCP